MEGGNRHGRRRKKYQSKSKKTRVFMHKPSITQRENTISLCFEWCGAVVLWCCGVVVLWCCGVVVLWCVLVCHLFKTRKMINAPHTTPCVARDCRKNTTQLTNHSMSSGSSLCVVPGQRLCLLENHTPGPGTFVHKQYIYASVVGFKQMLFDSTQV